MSKEWPECADHAAVARFSPLESIQLCEQLIAQHAITAVCGSSLGGFYALYLAEKYGLRCGLINPAITPWVDMEESKNHERYEIDELI